MTKVEEVTRLCCKYLTEGYEARDYVYVWRDEQKFKILDDIPVMALDGPAPYETFILSIKEVGKDHDPFWVDIKSFFKYVVDRYKEEDNGAETD